MFNCALILINLSVTHPAAEHYAHKSMSSGQWELKHQILVPDRFI